MSIKALQDYTSYARYAKHLPEKNRREIWSETVDRVFDMHEKFYSDKLKDNDELAGMFNEAKDGLLKKRILGSQRALQFGGNPIEKANAKLFNCAFGHVCYNKVFSEIMHILLCGCGVGFSVQKHHAIQISNVVERTKEVIVFTPEDSIEGWADCIGVLMACN